MNMNFKMNLKWKRISIIIVGMAGLSTLTFNCAPSMFQSAKSASNSSFGRVFDVFNAPKNSPYVLMTAKQTYKTFLNVTGQEGAQSNTQLNEFSARASSLSTNERLTNVNAPLQLAATSIAGEVCNGLLNKEVAAAAASRKFFSQVDFTKPVGQNSQSAFQSAVNVMAQSFWNRAPTADEAAQLNQFYNDFSATAGTAAAGTRNLFLGTCTGMLASLESYTF